MFSAYLLTTVLLALSAAASPVVVTGPRITLPIAKRFNITGTANILKSDLARAKGLRALAEARRNGLSSDAVISIPVQNQAVSYVASVGVGSPATQYSLLVDTGSSNTWVGAGKAYVRTSTSVQTSNRVAVTYGSGDFSGTEFTDTVTLAPGLVVQRQSIGVASRSDGFEGVDGILGLGPVDLTLDTLSPATNTLIPTVTDNLFSQGTVSNEFAVSFEPTTQEVANNGALTFGGLDTSTSTGPITFTPVTNTFPASEFWGINQSICYSNLTNLLDNTAGIVDTGTTLVLIASDAFAIYQRLTGAVLDNNTGLLRLTTAQFANLESLIFTINGNTFEFTANAQAWPRALNTAIGGTADNVYLIVGDLGTPSGQGFDFVNGLTFLERFYAVFDTTEKRVGFATTAFTHATTN